MGKKQLLTTLFLFLLSASLYAQTGKISGRVVDTNGEPLPGVNVVVDKTTTGTATDGDGYYTILNLRPGTYELVATYIGFTSVRVANVVVNVGLTTEADITMTEQLIQGEEIVVIAEQPVVKKDVSSSVATFSKENIEALPVASVTSVIGLQAGVEGLSIRGSGSDEVAFNFNGYNLRSERSNTPFTGLSVTAVENVQVQTGGFNAEYGDARSGIVQVTGKEGYPDRYTLDGIIRVTPPQKQTFGQSVNSPDSYWIRPYIDDDVAWTGTDNGAWDEFTQAQYQPFRGWNAVSREMLAKDPATALTPEAAQQLFLYQHRKKIGIDKPDYEIDLTLGGPIPVVSKKLGDLRFSTSFRRTNNEYLIPLSTNNYQQTTWQGRLTSNIASGMKLSVDGLYGVQRGTGASQVGGEGFFVTAAGIASNMTSVSYIDTRIYASDYWAPSKIEKTAIGATFTHTLSDKTFYEAKISYNNDANDTNPGAYRRDSTFTIGGLYFDEAPFGFYEATNPGIGSSMRMGVGMSTSRDSSRYSSLTASFDITSQVNRFNEVKAGFEFIRSDMHANYGSFDLNLPSGRYFSKYDAQPMRLSLYAQDKLEVGGMIANFGLRAMISDPNTDWYEYNNYSNVFKSGAGDGLDTLSTYKVKPQIILQPRLGVSFPITDNSKLFFNYGHFLQMPTPANLYLIQVEPFTNTIVRMSSPSTKIPKTVQYELGFEQSLLEKYLIRISGYYKDVTQQPQTVNFYGKNETSFAISAPLSYADRRGVELTFAKRAGGIFWGEVNYTYDVRSAGLFGTLAFFQNPAEQRDYNSSSTDNNITKPVPSPYARLQVFLRSPKDFGPKLFGVNPFGDWNASALLTWRAGAFVTYTGRGSIPGIVRNFRMRDSWGNSLRISKEFTVADRRINFFMDVDNVLNRRVLSTGNMGSIDGNDYLTYMESLHFPKKKLEEINQLATAVPGNDRPGDYRRPGVKYVPIVVSTDLSAELNPNTNVLYYNPTDEKYYQYVADPAGGNFIFADSKLVNQVLKDKAYINMPKQRFFNFFNPRTFRFGLRFSF